MSAYYKTIFTVTVLTEGSPVDISMDISDVLREMESGSFLGDVSHGPVVEIPADKIEDECEAVGNDGTYFTQWDDEEQEDA